MITDYGSAPYRLPLHTDYMKKTLSHSTIIPDGNCQLEAEGTYFYALKLIKNKKT